MLSFQAIISSSVLNFAFGSCKAEKNRASHCHRNICRTVKFQFTDLGVPTDVEFSISMSRFEVFKDDCNIQPSSVIGVTCVFLASALDDARYPLRSSEMGGLTAVA